MCEAARLAIRGRNLAVLTESVVRYVERSRDLAPIDYVDPFVRIKAVSDALTRTRLRRHGIEMILINERSIVVIADLESTILRFGAKRVARTYLRLCFFRRSTVSCIACRPPANSVSTFGLVSARS